MTSASICRRVVVNRVQPSEQPKRRRGPGRPFPKGVSQSDPSLRPLLTYFAPVSLPLSVTLIDSYNESAENTEACTWLAHLVEKSRTRLEPRAAKAGGITMRWMLVVGLSGL